MKRRLFVVSAILALLILCLGCVSAFADEVHHTITFHSGSDGTFSENRTTNVVEYGDGEAVTKYAHTSNVNDAGVQSGTYGRDLKQNVVVTIPDVDSLHVQLTVGLGGYLPNRPDHLYALAGDYQYSVIASDSTMLRDMSVIGDISGTATGETQVIEFDVVGNSVTFSLYTDSPSNVTNAYGYYAIVTGIISEELTGQYEVPTPVDPTFNFSGWNTVSDGSGDMFHSVSFISEDMDLYAVYAEAAHGTYRDVDWIVKENGHLIIGSDGVEQTFADVATQARADWPWYGMSIKSVSFVGTVNGYGLMNDMFAMQSDLVAFDATNFNTSLVTDMSCMFIDCKSVVTLDLSNFDVSNVTKMSEMFSGCRSIYNLVIDSWNPESVTSLYGFLRKPSLYGSSCRTMAALDLSGWNVSQVTNLGYAFYDVHIDMLNLTGWDVNNVTSASSMCQGFSGHLIMPDMQWSKLTSIEYMFYVTDGGLLDVPGWSFGKLTSAYYMFAFGDANVNAQNWNLDGVTSISNMFRQQNGDFVDISGMHSTTVTNASQMFEYSNGIRTITLSDCVFPALTNMYSMFCTDNNLESIIGLDTWDISSVTNLSQLFLNCSKLGNVSVANWNTANVTNMTSVFSNCAAMTEIDVSGWDLRNVTSNSNMFSISSAYINGSYVYSDLAIKSIILGENFRFVGSGCTFPCSSCMSCTWEREDTVYGPFDYNKMYENWTPEMAGKWVWGSPVYAFWDRSTKSLVFLRSREGVQRSSVAGWNYCIQDLDGNVYYTNDDDDFYKNIETRTDCPWDSWIRNSVVSVYSTGLKNRPIKPKACYMWFYNAYNLESADVSGFDFSNCTTMYEMFGYCSKLSSLDVSHFNIQNVTNMDYTFAGCQALTELDVSNFNTQSLTSMSYTFYGCNKLESLDISQWDTSHVTTMYAAFESCISLKTLNVSGIDTSHVVNMNYMFSYSPAIEYLDLSSFDCSSVNYMGDMFYGCNGLSKVKLGEKNPFIGVGTAKTVLPTPPDSRNGVNYTGLWIHESGDYGPYTSAELMNSYESSMSGFWVWQNTAGLYTIMFEPGDADAVGGWPNQFISASESYRIPKNVYRKFGYIIDHWEDGRGHIYDDQGTIPANTYVENNVVVLRAMMSPIDSSIDMQGGSFEVRLHGNEKAFFDGIPTGTSYQVYEQTPEGWVLIQYEDATGQIRYMTESESKFANEYRPDVIAVQLNGLKVLDGEPVAAGTYSFELLDADRNVLQTVDVLDGGLIQFEPMEFTRDEVGVYQYYIREVLGDESVINYDSHEESITIDVHENIGEPIIKYLYTDNLSDTGEKLSDYESYKYYTGVVRIDGADRLHVEVVHSNPRGQFYIWQGDYSGVLSNFYGSYNGDFNPSLPGTRYIPYVSGKDHELITEEFDIDGDALSVLWYSYAQSPSSGYYPDGPYSDVTNYGYYMTVSYAERELVADVSRDDDGIVFQNEHKPGKLTLEKVGSDVAPANVIFYYDVEFTYENGQPYEAPDASLVYEERDGKRIDYPDILLPEEKPKYVLTVNHIYVDADGHEETTTETSEYYARGVFTVMRAEQSGYLYGRIVGNNLVQSNSTSWKGIMPENDVIVDVYYYAQRPVTGSVVWNDQDNWGGIRPSSVTVHLLKDDASVAYQTISADDGWAFSFDDMPVYENGEPIEYEVMMEDVDDYEIGVEETTITASHRAYWTYTFHNYDYRTHEPLVMTYLDQTGADIVIKLACDQPYSFEIDSAPAGYNLGAVNVDNTVQYGLFQGTMTQDEELDLYWERGTELPSVGGATLRLDIEHPSTLKISAARDAVLEDMPIAGSVYSLYKIGDYLGDLEFSVNDAFASLQLLEKLESGEYMTMDAAQKALQVIRGNNIGPVSLLTVGEDGSAGPITIADGLYVLTMTRAAEGLVSCDILFPMPYYSRNDMGVQIGGIIIGEDYAYDPPATASPTPSPTPSPSPSPSPTPLPGNTGAPLPPP